MISLVTNLVQWLMTLLCTRVLDISSAEGNDIRCIHMWEMPCVTEQACKACLISDTRDRMVGTSYAGVATML